MSDLLRAPLNEEVPANGNPGNAGSRFKHWMKLWLVAAGEALKCLGLGARDALSPRIFIRSAALCIAASLLWIWIYVQFFQEMMEFFGKLALMSFVGLFFSGIQFIVPHYSLSGSGSNVAINPLGAALGMLRIAEVFLIVAAVAVILYVLVYLFAVASTVRVVTPVLLMTGARMTVLKRYPPSAEVPNEIPAASSRFRSLVLLLVGLCIPVISGYLIVLGLCYLNVRLLYATVAGKTASPEMEMKRLEVKWRPLLLLGMALMFLTAIPVLNLLVPGMMCTCILHLVYREPCELRLTCPPQSPR